MRVQSPTRDSQISDPSGKLCKNIMFLSYNTLPFLTDHYHPYSTDFGSSNHWPPHHSAVGWKRGLEPESRDFLCGFPLLTNAYRLVTHGSRKSRIFGDVCQVFDSSFLTTKLQCTRRHSIAGAD